MFTTIRRVVLTGVVAVLAGAQAWAVTPIASCPFTISASGNYIVTADLLTCAGDGIDINASNVTVNLNGHIITGSATVLGTGIAVNTSGSPRLNHIGISGPGLIESFGGGIFIQNSDYVQVSQTTVAGNIFGGVGGENVTYLTVGGNVIVANGSPYNPPYPTVDTFGLLLLQSTGVQVTGNQVVGNRGDGIVLQSGDSNTLTGNVASGNAGSGILMGDTSFFDSQTTAPLTNSRVSSNTTNGNLWVGIGVESPTRACSHY